MKVSLEIEDDGSGQVAIPEGLSLLTGSDKLHTLEVNGVSIPNLKLFSTTHSISVSNQASFKAVFRTTDPNG